MKQDFTHFDENGQAVMVDISAKNATKRIARAQACMKLHPLTIDKVKQGTLKKGDVLSIARIAGIMAAKKTPDLIPLCHPIALTKITIDFDFVDNTRILIDSLCETVGKTGVEMEAMQAVSTAALTVYDMVKSVEKSAIIEYIKLIEKDGGKSGHYQATSTDNC